jgi:hypothetical protein
VPAAGPPVAADWLKVDAGFAGSLGKGREKHRMVSPLLVCTTPVCVTSACSEGEVVPALLPDSCCTWTVTVPAGEAGSNLA